MVLSVAVVAEQRATLEQVAAHHRLEVERIHRKHFRVEGGR